jgi:hypothetical protein
MGVADPNRLAVMAELWRLHDHGPSRRPALQSSRIGAGVTNLWSFTGTADILGFCPTISAANRGRVRELLKHSPITT